MTEAIVESVRKGVHSLRSLDVRTLLISTLIMVSTGHVGRLFADREDVRQVFVGYVLALSIDGVLAVSLYEMANVRQRSHRVFALFVFLFACAVSAGFNVAYYRQNYPLDPPEISLLLGITAPILAALVSVLKSFGDVERTEAKQSEREAERVAEYERYKLEQAEQTRRVQIVEQERTKRERAKARAEKARANAIAQVKVQSSEHHVEHQGKRDNGRLKPGERDELARAILLERPELAGPRPLARELGCSPSTASAVLKRLRSNGDHVEGGQR